jgi:hypothetical protein
MAVISLRSIVEPCSRSRSNLASPSISKTCGVSNQRDLLRAFGRVVLPAALERKYPNAATEWSWQFVFPATRIRRDPRFGPPSRYHVDELVIQRAVPAAVRRTGLTKRVSWE